VPLHPPPNPAKLKPEVAVAVRVTVVPELNFAVQVPGQLMPAGLLVTVPLPVTVTVNWACWAGGGGGGGGGGVLLFVPPPQSVSASGKDKTSGTHKRKKRLMTPTPWLRSRVAGLLRRLSPPFAPLKARNSIPELGVSQSTRAQAVFIANEELWNEIHDYVAEGKGVLRRSRLLWAGRRKAPATQERRQHCGGYES